MENCPPAVLLNVTNSANSAFMDIASQQSKGVEEVLFGGLRISSLRFSDYVILKMFHFPSRYLSQFKLSGVVESRTHDPNSKVLTLGAQCKKIDLKIFLLISI